MQIVQVDDLTPYRAELVEILIETVAAGASIGFLAPISKADAESYWRTVDAAMKTGKTVTLVARENGKIYGTVQLALAQKANARHRAEIEKLMVHPKSRGHGIGHKLMAALEQTATTLGRTLLLMDTRRGGVADGLYGRLGYTRFGIVPAFTIDSEGASHDTCFFYKQLKPAK